MFKNEGRHDTSQKLTGMESDDMSQLVEKRDEKLSYLKRTYMTRRDVIRMRYRLVRIMLARGKIFQRMLMMYVVLSFVIYYIVFFNFGILTPGGGIGALISVLYLGMFFFQNLNSARGMIMFFAGITLLQLMMISVHALNVHFALNGLNQSPKKAKKSSRDSAPLSTIVKNLFFSGSLVILLNVILLVLATLVDTQGSNFGHPVTLEQVAPFIFVVEMFLNLYLAIWIPEYHVTRYFTKHRVLMKSFKRFREDAGSILAGNALVVIIPTILGFTLLSLSLILLQLMMTISQPGVRSSIYIGGDIGFLLLFILLLLGALFFGMLDVLNAMSVVSIHLTPEPNNLLKLLEDEWMNEEFTIFRYVGGVDEALSCPNCFSLLVPPFITKCPYCSETRVQHQKCPQCSRPLKFSPYYCPYCKWERRPSEQAPTSQLQ